MNCLAGQLGNVSVDQWDELVSEASRHYGVPASWIKAVIQVESGGNPSAYNPDDPGGSRGLMQISGPTAHAYGILDPNSLFDPVVNVGVGTQILSDLRSHLGDDFRRVYSAYNSGNPDLYETSIEVADHVEKAVTALAAYAGAAVGAFLGPGGAETMGNPSESFPWGLLVVGIVVLRAGRRRRRR